MNVYLILILLILISYYLKRGNTKCEKFTIKKTNSKYLGEVVDGYVKKNNIEHYDESNKNMIYMLNTSLYDDVKRKKNNDNNYSKSKKSMNIKNIIIICVILIILFNIL